MTNAIKALAQWKGSIPQDGLLDFVLKVILALIVYFIGTKLIGWLCKNLRKHLIKFGSDEAAKSFLLSGIKIGLHLILILTIAGNLGVDKTSVAALVGSAGVAISLALQGGLSNFASCSCARFPLAITSSKMGKRPRERYRRSNCTTPR